jgi:hypothetical protein
VVAAAELQAIPEAAAGLVVLVVEERVLVPVQPRELQAQ